MREWLHANRSFAQRGVLHPRSDKSVVRNFSELGRVGIDDEAGERAAGKRPDESRWSKKSIQLSPPFGGSAATKKVVARIQDRPDEIYADRVCLTPVAPDRAAPYASCLPCATPQRSHPMQTTLEMSTIKLISQSHESDGFARRSQPLLVEIYSRRTSLRIDAAVRSCGKTTGGWRSPFAPGFG